MAVREIVKIGHFALKTKNKPVKSFASAKTKKLLRDLRDTMRKNELVGIAAPQIGENYLVFLTEPRKTKYRPKENVDELRVFINPKIAQSSKQANIIYEGCGCVGNIFGPVKRSKKVTIEALGAKGDKFQLTTDGLLARVILHEMDHLQGIEFLQRIKDNQKLVHTEHYKKYIRNSKRQKQNSKITKLEYKKI
ncbi:MAG: peptide deformylase [Patescibacteria group bacterium]